MDILEGTRMRSALPLRLLLAGTALCFSIGLVSSRASAAVTAGTVTGSTPLLTGTFASGQNGDLILENDEIVVIVSAIGHTPYQGISGGTVIDIGSSVDRIDALAELYPYFDDNFIIW